MVRLFGLIAIAFYLTSCGGDEITYYTESYNNQVVSKVASGEKPEKCIPEKFGEMIYWVDSAAVFFCDENAWVRMTFAYEKDTVVVRDTIYIEEANSSSAESSSSEETLGESSSSKPTSSESTLVESSSSSVEDDYVTDSRDGAKYKTVTIGSQTWMAENLNYASETSWCYENDKSMCEKYGRLYTIVEAKEVCPIGWRLPTETDWEKLVNLIQKEQNLDKWNDVVPFLISATGWSGVESSGNYGFSAYPAGTKKYSDSTFYGLGDETNFWAAEGTCLMIKSESLVIEAHSNSYGFSIRCLKK